MDRKRKWSAIFAPVLLVVASLVFSAGCVRYVAKGPDYGVVAMPINTDVWPLRFRQKAKSLMDEHFPNGYVIEQEGEAVVGQTINTESDHITGPTYQKGNWAVGLGHETSTTSVSDQKEWRILYRSK